MDGITDSNYEDLANAIILSAIKDYKTAHRRLKKANRSLQKLISKVGADSDIFLNADDYRNAHKNRKYGIKSYDELLELEKEFEEENKYRTILSRLEMKQSLCEYSIAECRNFFNSAWYEALSESDGKIILEILDSELATKGYK